MDNKDFDQLFNEKFDTTQSFDFREEDWDDVVMKLDRDQQKDRILGWWFWPSVIGLLGLGLILWLANDLNNTQKIVKELSTQKNRTTVTIIDTIRQTIIITEYDTIRKTIVVEENISPAITVEKRALSNWHSTSSKTVVTKSEEDCDCPEEIPKAIDTIEKVNLLLKSNKEEKGEKEAEQLNQYELLNYSALKAGLLEVSIRMLPETQELVIAKMIEPIPKIRSWSIGVVAGWLSPQSPATLIDTIENEIINRSNHIGIRAEWKFSDHWCIVGDVSRQKLNYDFRGLDSLRNYFIEESAPEFLNVFEAEQENWNYSLGIKYLWFNQKRFQPYTSIRLFAQSNLKQSVNGTIDGIYLEPTAYQGNRAKSSFQLEAIQPILGIQTELNKWMNLQVEGNYHLYFNKNEDRFRNKSGINAAILFKLN